MLRNQGWRLLIALLTIWLAFELVTNPIAKILWFQEIGYLSTFIKRFLSQLGLSVFTSTISLGFLVVNLRVAKRFQWHSISEGTKKRREKIVSQSVESNNYISSIDFQEYRPQSPVLPLSLLLPLALGFSLLLGLMLLYYTKVTLQLWHPDYTLPNIIPSLPLPFQFSILRETILQIAGNWWQLGLLVSVIAVLLINYRLGLKAIALSISFLFGLVLSGNWTRFVRYFYPTDFDRLDPLFGKNISFYVFRLPVWQLIDFWLGGLSLCALLAVSLNYLLSGNSFSQGKFPGFSAPQLRHIYALGGMMMFALSLRHWLARYELLYSPRGVSYGASYTEVKIQLPFEAVLSILSIAIAIWLIYRAMVGWQRNRNRRKNPSVVWIISAYLVTVVTGLSLAWVVQRFDVQPNELARETPYIERSIDFTRAAFDLNNIEAETFNPQGQLTASDLAKNHLTIDNIRLWDTRPLLETNKQLQQIRLYYRFTDADIDRYTLTTAKSIDKQQVIIAARELDYNAVPQEAQTWVNEHLVYTHGYGFTVSPVNRVSEGGLPYYFVKDIGTGTTADKRGTLYTSSPAIAKNIPIGQPRIYYGESTDTYIMTSTKVQEFDFPSGQDNTYNTYDGTGGINIGSFWRRLVFAGYLKDWRMLFTSDFTPETRLLFRRNINVRARSIAPFLHYDADPYLVAVDAEDTNQIGEKNYLYWIIDAYTTSDRYPYSDPGQNRFNYIRNSVKVVVNAYNGDIDFYISDTKDPIIKTWSKIFPNLFKSLDEMPEALRLHIRYPEDFFQIQSERLLTYHMSDPQVFYNREDQWQIPQEIYGTKSQPVEPYYLIMRLPTETEEEFILLSPYTPTSRPNLIAWLAARSDGKEYGRLLLYQFPKQKLIYGPDQVEALINQDPVISQQISLWNRQGSRVIQGNLLIIPIEQSLLYVEPIYLEAEKNSLPTLVRVIVVYENQIVMAETLDKALETIFTANKPTTPAIIRNVETSG
jgi:hypothetical protein